ncbi:MAG: heme NO-binding domain-containing protein [Chloroflexi bacterium]|nr:heme NO-binding domain-containing protein [Chloroflexota bacterium]
MYGLVNRAIEELVCTTWSEEIWESIKEEAGIDIEAFIRLESYTDEVTYKLV